MPLYEFENTQTGEIITLEMKIAERDEYVANNPHMTQLLTKMNLTDPLKIGKSKNPRLLEFQKYVLPRIHAGAGRQSKIGKGRWDLKREV